jgi:hypothetical protein
MIIHTQIATVQWAETLEREIGSANTIVLQDIRVLSPRDTRIDPRLLYVQRTVHQARGRRVWK